MITLDWKSYRSPRKARLLDKNIRNKSLVKANRHSLLSRMIRPIPRSSLFGLVQYYCIRLNSIIIIIISFNLFFKTLPNYTIWELVIINVLFSFIFHLFQRYGIVSLVNIFCALSTALFIFTYKLCKVYVSIAEIVS